VSEFLQILEDYVASRYGSTPAGAALAEPVAPQ
jgi:hypothetical protein